MYRQFKEKNKNLLRQTSVDTECAVQKASVDVNISNDQQMSLISHFRSFNSSFQKCRLKIANREWKTLP
jgi:hypothetical protein